MSEPGPERPGRRQWILGCLVASLLVVLAGVGLLYAGAYWALQRLPLDSAPIRTLEGVEAYRELGTAGSRCLNQALVSYDPRQQAPDSVMVDEPPERAIEASLPAQDAVVEHVVVHHRIPQAEVWVQLRSANGTSEQRVFKLVAQTGQTVTLRLPHRPIVICYAHVGNWLVVDDEPAPTM